MALQTKPSRFAVLPDDVPDPVSSKVKNKGGGGANSGDGDKSNKNKNKQAKNNNNGKKAAGNQKPKQTLKGLAFGGSGDGKPLVPVSMRAEPVAGPSKSSIASTSTKSEGVPNGNGKTSAQWEEWQRRDSELVVGDYESQLEAALIQSKLEFEKEQLVRGQLSQGKSKSKKKPVPVSLNEFNAKLAQQPKAGLSSLPNQHARGMNGNIGDFESTDNIEELDKEFLDKLRMDAKLEMDRGKQLAVERELIKSRQSNSVPNKKNSKKVGAVPVVVPAVDPKDEELDRLRVENEQLKEETESYKARLKKVYDIFQEAQELKDKAKLLLEIENLRKMNQDQSTEVQILHSQLEQERSKSHAALNEYRKLMEHTRRRTNTEASQ